MSTWKLVPGHKIERRVDLWHQMGAATGGFMRKMDIFGHFLPFRPHAPILLKFCSRAQKWKADRSTASNKSLNLTCLLPLGVFFCFWGFRSLSLKSVIFCLEILYPGTLDGGSICGMKSDFQLSVLWFYFYFILKSSLNPDLIRVYLQFNILHPESKLDGECFDIS